MHIETKNPPKHMRSFRLATDINDKLDFVCKTFGVTVNSYLVSEIGKAVVRDCLILKTQDSNDKTLDALSAMLTAVMEQNDRIEDISKD
jgi:hypothetical protein